MIKTMVFKLIQLITLLTINLLPQLFLNHYILHMIPSEKLKPFNRRGKTNILPIPNMPSAVAY